MWESNEKSALMLNSPQMNSEFQENMVENPRPRKDSTFDYVGVAVLPEHKNILIKV